MLRPEYMMFAATAKSSAGMIKEARVAVEIGGDTARRECVVSRVDAW